MENYKDVIDTLGGIRLTSGQCTDLWEHLGISGDVSRDALTSLASFAEACGASTLEKVASIEINGESYNAQDLRAFLAAGDFYGSWRLDLSKAELSSEAFPHERYEVRFFLSATAFEAALKLLAPFDPENPLRKSSALYVVVPGIMPFGGPRLRVAPEFHREYAVDWPSRSSLPDDRAVRRQVHVISGTAVQLSPEPFLIDWGATDSGYSSIFSIFLAQTLAACLVHEFHNANKVVIRGIKRLELRIFGEDCNLHCLEQLRQAVEWVYEERSDTRQKLLVDRLSLDLASDKPLLATVCEVLRDSFAQAREQYEYVVRDLVDTHIGEIRELLKDVRAQADLYAGKVRALLDMLLRDLLAVLFLLAISFLEKAGASAASLISPAVVILFKGMAIYFLLAISLQVLVTWRDLSLSDAELTYWVNVSRRYMGLAEARKHIDDNIRPRRDALIRIGAGLVLFYLLLAALAWFYEPVVKWLIGG